MSNQAPDTLRSIATTKILDLVCEGPIEGFPVKDADPGKFIYLDDVPIKNMDGTSNFSDYSYDSDSFVKLSYDYRLGTNSQNYISGFDTTESVVSIPDGRIKGSTPEVNGIYILLWYLLVVFPVIVSLLL